MAFRFHRYTVHAKIAQFASLYVIRISFVQRDLQSATIKDYIVYAENNSCGYSFLLFENTINYSNVTGKNHRPTTTKSFLWVSWNVVKGSYHNILDLHFCMKFYILNEVYSHLFNMVHEYLRFGWLHLPTQIQLRVQAYMVISEPCQS